MAPVYLLRDTVITIFINECYRVGDCRDSFCRIHSTQYRGEIMLLLFFIWTFHPKANGVEYVFERTPLVVPESAGVYVDRPYSFTHGENDRIYALDVGSQCLLVWDRQYQFEHTIGRKGDGPGELNIKNLRGYVGFNGKHIVVCDGEKLKLHFFENGAYVKTENAPPEGRMISAFGYTNNGYCIMQRMNITDKTTKLVVYDENFQVVKELAKFTNLTWTRNKDKQFVFTAFLPQLVSHFSYHSPYIISGYSENSNFDLYSAIGSKLETVSFERKRREVTALDRSKYDHWKTRFELHFAELHPVYDYVYPMGENQFMVFSQALNSGVAFGQVITRNGDTIGSFEEDFGDMGGVLFTGKELVGLYESDEEDLQIAVLVLKKTGQM